MPMSGSNYVAPTWVNNAPPALDAAELQAMCNTIEQNQGDIASLTASLSNKAQIVTGSYVGNGAYGNSNPTEIHFTGNPLFIIIQRSGNSTYGNAPNIFLNGLPSLVTNITNAGYSSAGYYLDGNAVETVWTSQKLSIYGRSALLQFNISGETYKYCIAFV